jgi:methionyl-tRNA synthetase
VTTSCYLTTAIDYPLGRPHVGNALEKLAADVLARFHRMEGHPTRLLVGSDEHTVLVPRQAAALGMRPEALADERAAFLRDAWGALGISPDDFIRTSEPRHVRAARAFSARIQQRGMLTVRPYAGWYCENCEQFKKPAELNDGRCRFHPHVEVRQLAGDSYVFALAGLRDRLLALYRERPDWVEPAAVRDQLVAAIERDLDDLPITRAGLEWGIRAPFDESHTLYVWFDALVSYLTAAGYETDPAVFAGWWPARVQIIGRDIAWFHGVLWPALLLAGGLEPPDKIQVHGLLSVDGTKMSKTAGNVVDALDLVRQHGLDPVRYYLLRYCPFRDDSDFSRERLRAAYEEDLAGTLGGLFDRWFALARRRRDAPPTPRPASSVRDRLAQVALRVAAEIVEVRLDTALETVWRDLLAPARRALAQAEGDNAETERVLPDLAVTLRGAAILLKPFLPETSQRMYQAFTVRPAWDAVRLADAAAGADAPPPVGDQDLPPLFPPSAR